MIGTMAGRPLILAWRAIRQTNSEPMMERARETSPSDICPRALKTAMRALLPVPVGERSILPGRMTHAFEP
jgi:hypothetical protein